MSDKRSHNTETGLDNSLKNGFLFLFCLRLVMSGLQLKITEEEVSNQTEFMTGHQTPRQNFMDDQPSFGIYKSNAKTLC